MIITETYPVCLRETGTPWLYVSTPSRGRMATILAGQFTASAFAGRWLQKNLLQQDESPSIF